MICSKQERLVFQNLHKSANGIRGAYNLVKNKNISVGIQSRCGRKFYASGMV